MNNQELVLNVVKGVFALLALLAVAVFVVKPLLQHLLRPVDTDLFNPTFVDTVEGEEIDVPTDEDAKMPGRHELIETARRDPATTASQIRRWLNEK